MLVSLKPLTHTQTVVVYPKVLCCCCYFFFFNYETMGKCCQLVDKLISAAKIHCASRVYRICTLPAVHIQFTAVFDEN